MEYLYARKRFAWDAPDFAMFGVVASTVPAIGNPSLTILVTIHIFSIIFSQMKDLCLYCHC